MESTWTFNVGPVTFDGVILYMTALTVLIVFGLIYWASRNMQLKPTGKQNVLEWVVDFINGIGRENLGAKESPKYALMSFTLFSFLLISNIIGLVTKITAPGDISLWRSPTANSTVDLTLAVLVIVLANTLGVKQFGFKGYLKNAFWKEPKAMLPMTIMEEFTNALSMGLRLYGNIFAGEVLLGIIAGMIDSGWFILPVTWILAMAWIAFSIFISSLQAYVFVLLTNLYISHKILAEH
ncbi:F0F1 ATP synthase subunit A [Lactococcus formosensis]|jgi:F-type H+-transporting ATPase subunit a|uniref:ATP synthase subunit a n=1 Tax=Lactococcus formosensis TaxID=1281486 RepID=A0A9X4NVD7_9LACT|nr:F0F1 ATP synthase subunit A [Lactococcus formosensis]NHI66857.1 F0F1 ATP synthase subunit A [Lactococcus garvieae]MCH1723167.1 F0F1 ATP synthase subunit A [Lactococcus formosensis]MCO7179618.1 F0F1 ATP synthase subunit A [Lactococcus formosensis]MDG6110710.1 F0F1 ATP synthase subunit A [Lactococcus formosensis]MDG6112892.1 F0F1 ATP synthase subunit A [Lactococcus formosensis]